MKEGIIPGREIKEVDTPVIRNWYKCIVTAAHQGGGKIIDTTNYVYAVDAVEAMMKLKKMGGVKLGKNRPFSKNVTFDIHPLTDSEVQVLEQRIRDTPGVTLEQMKKNGYHGTRRK